MLVLSTTKEYSLSRILSITLACSSVNPKILFSTSVTSWPLIGVLINISKSQPKFKVHVYIEKIYSHVIFWYSG